MFSQFVSKSSMSLHGTTYGAMELSVFPSAAASGKDLTAISILTDCAPAFPSHATDRFNKDAKLLQDFYEASQLSQLLTDSGSDLTSWGGVCKAAGSHVARSIWSVVTRNDKPAELDMTPWPEPVATLSALQRLHELNLAVTKREDVERKFGSDLSVHDLAQKLERESTSARVSQLGHDLIQLTAAAFLAEEKVLRLCLSLITVVVAVHRRTEGDEFCLMQCSLDREKEAIERQYRSLSLNCRQAGFLHWATFQVGGGKGPIDPYVRECQVAIEAVVKAVEEDANRFARLAEEIRLNGIPRNSVSTEV